MTRARPENAIQSDIIGFLRAVLPPDYIPFAIPNGARRTIAGGASNGVPGLLPGMPDIGVGCPDSMIFYLEVKAPRGKLSEPQQHVIRRLLNNRSRVAVVRSIKEVEDALALWQIPTRIARTA